MTKRQRSAAASGGVGADFEVPDSPQQPITPRVSRPSAPAPALKVAPTAPAAASPQAAPARASMLMEALKEELFELEVEHKQGKITQQEYEKAKAALDGTLALAIKRDAQKA